jgi:hypothetical protein
MKREPQDDMLLRSYLLGELREEEADRLEQRLLEEDELFELAEAVEADLLAAVDGGGLAPAERERVLRRLASSPQGRERLALARSLNAAATQRTVLPFSRRARAFPPPAIHWVALAASLLMLSGLGWFAWEHRTQAPDTVSRLAVPTPEPLPRHAPVVTPVPDSARPPIPPIEKTPKTPKALKTPESAPGPVAPRQQTRPAAASSNVLALTLMGLRGGEEEVAKLHLSPGKPMTEIQIDTEDVDAQSFDVAIRNWEKETIWQKNGIEPTPISGSQVLIIDLPTKRLAAGRYEVGVTPQGAEEIPLEFAVEAETH